MPQPNDEASRAIAIAEMAITNVVTVAPPLPMTWSMPMAADPTMTVTTSA